MRENHRDAVWLSVFIGAGIFITGISISMGLESRMMILKFIIILAGFLLPINYAAAAAFLIPILSTLTFGYPHVFPELPLTICEAIALTSFSNIYYYSAKLRIYPSLIITLIMGELVLFSAASVLSWVTQGFSAIAYTAENFIGTLPGLLIQFAFIPLFVKITEIIKSRAKDVGEQH